MNQPLAAVMYSYGTKDSIKIESINMPQASPGKVIVKVTAAGVNPIDWKLRDGVFKDLFPLTFPCVLGGEFAGEIVEVGEGVTSFSVGDRVIGKPVNRGAFAETIEISPDQLIHTPYDLVDTVAASLPVAVLTAWTGLFDIGDLKMGIPWFQFKEMLFPEPVIAFSSNNGLYASMSNRFVSLLEELATRVEQYSVDECFVSLEGLGKFISYEDYCRQLREHVYRGTGLTIGVGMGPTLQLSCSINL